MPASFTIRFGSEVRRTNIIQENIGGGGEEEKDEEEEEASLRMSLIPGRISQFHQQSLGHRSQQMVRGEKT